MLWRGHIWRTFSTVFTLLLCIWKVYGFDFFNDGPDGGTSSMLYAIDVGLDSISGSIGCFGDFNSDK